MPGRNENSVKNHFFSLLKREKKNQNISNSSKSEDKPNSGDSMNTAELTPNEDEIIKLILRKLESKQDFEKMAGFLTYKYKYLKILNMILTDEGNNFFTLNEIQSEHSVFNMKNQNIFQKEEGIKSLKDLPHFLADKNIFIPQHSQSSFQNYTNQVPNPSVGGVFDMNQHFLKEKLNQTLLQNNIFSPNYNLNRNTNIDQHGTLSNLEYTPTLNPFILESFKNMEEEINKYHNFPTFGKTASNEYIHTKENVEIQKHLSETLIKNTNPIPVNHYVNSSESLKEIRIMQKLNNLKEEEEKTNPENNTPDQFLKLKIIPLTRLNLKEKQSHIFHALLDLNKHEIVVLKQFTQNLSPKSSGSQNSYLSALLSLNQSFGSLKMPSNDSIKSSEGNFKFNTGFQKCNKETNINLNLGLANSRFKNNIFKN